MQERYSVFFSFLIEKYMIEHLNESITILLKKTKKYIISFNIFKHVSYINLKGCDGGTVAQTHCNIFP